MAAILAIIFLVGVLALFHAGLRAFFKKFFGVELEFKSRFSRGHGYHQNIDIEQIKRNTKYYDELGKIAKESLKRKGLEPTIENIMNEAEFIESQLRKRR